MLKKIVKNRNFEKFGINCTLERSSIIKILKKNCQKSKSLKISSKSKCKKNRRKLECPKIIKIEILKKNRQNWNVVKIVKN